MPKRSGCSCNDVAKRMGGTSHDMELVVEKRRGTSKTERVIKTFANLPTQKVMSSQKRCQVKVCTLVFQELGLVSRSYNDSPKCHSILLLMTLNPLEM